VLRSDHEAQYSITRESGHLTRRQILAPSVPLVSVVIPSYNHARFVREAIASVESQTYDNLELIVIDDGSTDGSASIIEKTLSDSRLQRLTFRRQPNLGAATTIDRGIMLASGDYIAILNSDDLFATQRIQTFLELVVPSNHDAFVFSGITFQSRDGSDLEQYLPWYLDAMRLAATCPSAGFALLATSLTVSTSNFFFNRALFDKLHGFNNNLLLAHDWDFVLRAIHYVEPQFVPDELLTYRYHRGNSSHDLHDRHLEEGTAALARFVELDAEPAFNEHAPTRGNWPVFFDFFCSHVSPWFSVGPLTQHLETIGASRGNSMGRLRSQVADTRDATAIRRLREGLATNVRITMPRLPLLRRQIAENWRPNISSQHSSAA
jgi:glycosyltransferase involved in cell wall biosynthesis